MHFTVEAQKFACRYLSRGDVAIDATCGNGLDTVFLAQQVGCDGVVYAIDLQPSALAITRQKLLDTGLIGRCRLVAGSHSELGAFVDPNHVGRVSVVMFNLGYLPFGDKGVVTTASSTIAGLNHALKLLRPKGLISVLAYPGHIGGLEESQRVAEWVEGHDESFRPHSEFHADGAFHADRAFRVERFQDFKNLQSPILWLLSVR
jgi:SAM-dependent methyltransferase